MTLLGLDSGLAISLSSLVFSCISFFANSKFGKRARLKEIQKIVKDYQDQLKEATKMNNEKKLKELQVRESEVLSLTQEMLVLPFRSMIIVLPLFFGALWLVPPQFPSYTITLPFSIPIPDLAHFSLNWRASFGPRGAFILWAFVFGMLIEMIMSRLEKAKAAKKVN